MTVAELIAALHDLPPDAVVGYAHYREDGDRNFVEVSAVRLGTVSEIETWGPKQGPAALLNEG